jgi:hypothetical protein
MATTDVRLSITDGDGALRDSRNDVGRGEPGRQHGRVGHQLALGDELLREFLSISQSYRLRLSGLGSRGGWRVSRSLHCCFSLNTSHHLPRRLAVCPGTSVAIFFHLLSCLACKQMTRRCSSYSRRPYCRTYVRRMTSSSDRHRYRSSGRCLPQVATAAGSLRSLLREGSRTRLRDGLRAHLHDGLRVRLREGALARLHDGRLCAPV